MSEQRLRLDKWLWYARFYKSRTLAAGACTTGRIRVNGAPIDKAHQVIKTGDVLTFPHGPHIRILRVLALGARRGPPSEARFLYEDLAPLSGSESARADVAQQTGDQH
jgi:ribosome-associated heat shock protein Hsp15